MHYESIPLLLYFAANNTYAYVKPLDVYACLYLICYVPFKWPLSLSNDNSLINSNATKVLEN